MTTPHAAARPMPLVFILEEMNFGGTQRQALELARHIDRNLFTPEIWTVRAGDALIPQALEANIPVTILRNDSTLRPFLAAYALWKKLRKTRPQLIHLCTVFPNVWGRIFGKILNLPAIVGGCKGQGNIRLQHEKIFWPLAHGHICDAKSIKEGLQALGVPNNRVHFITNGVNVDFFVPTSTPVNTPEILCVGRMVEEKDHTTLLKAFSIVQKQIPAARLHLVGDGPLRGKMQKLSSMLGLEQNIIFYGSSSTVREHMQAAKMFVLSSISEGTPNVLLEAMASGLPIVATAVAGIPDMVEHEKQGLLVPPRRPEELAKAMVQILSDDSLAQSMGRVGRAHVCTNYSLEKVARAHEAVYTNLTLL